MPNGKPGDHPITDICIHKLPVFSPAIDGLIVRIIDLGGRARLDQFDWFAPPTDPAAFESHLQAICHELEQAARKRGWELHG